MQGTEQGMQMVRRMSAVVKKLDATRPVTAAQSGGQFNPENVSQAVDVVGFNYQQGSYDRFHQEHPTLPITSSEDTSAFMTRGEYVNDGNRHIRSSYDTERAPWGATHRDAWQAIAERPFVAGGFVWTGFDYRGEPTPYQWPSAGSFFGCMDLCGFPKMAFYLHQAQWVKYKPILTLVPHWNWPGQEGKPIKVMALANCDSVELSLNGKSLGENPVDKYEMVFWDVPYAPGKLEAVGKQDGKVVSHFTVETTGEPVALRLVPDRTTLAGDGRDAMPVTVEALDAAGRPVPTANLLVNFAISGPGAIIGVGNGDPNCHETEKLAPQPAIRTIPLNEGWRWAKVPDVHAAGLAEIKPEFDDSAWPTTGTLGDNGNLPENTQAVFRKTIGVSDADLAADQTEISFGSIDDEGWIYVNGQLAGQAHDWQAVQRCDVKRLLHAGQNVMAVAVINSSGPGGISKGVSLRLHDLPVPPDWKRSLFNGLAQVIVQSDRDRSGTITLRASAGGLQSAETTIQVSEVPPRPSVPPL
jgi:hypothetical protein